ncbi:MAG: type II secretion system F family protein [Ruminococcus sp.]|nr:type II secretion system F family protein [Oscillospiraceae bacterium]MDD6271372.1 type II secretion system F family protein [Ruminococcus sp.]MDD7345220.1 type II secretion system F family protein [Ruminococcus sp.]MDY6059735.1 type II secretion system F family protein [Candidatus Fimenecus sp.]
MASFTYDGMNRQGQNVHGEVVADNSSAAMDKLREAGIIVTDIKEKVINEKKKSGGKKVSIQDVAVFARQMAAMISAGVPVTRALATLAKQTTNPTLSAAIVDISENVESGMPLSDAFAMYPKIFDDLFVAMIATGEVGGILEQSLISLANQLQKNKALKDNIKSAVSYPKNIGIFAIILLIAMLAFMVPIFQKMIPSGTELNGLTQFIFNASTSLRTQWYLWILVAAVIIVALRFIIKSKFAHTFWEKNKLHMPLIGDFITKMVIARFCRTLATLLAGGVTAVEALQSAGPTSGSDLIRDAVNDAISDIEEGKSISDSLDKSGLFPPMVTGMIAIGEEAGTLPELLDKVAEFYEEDVEATSRNLGSIIEPIALIGIGGLVGAMLISLYLPIFTASTSIGS